MERFSDFATIKPSLEGDKVKIDSILNEEIIVTNFEIDKSKFNKNGNEKYVRIQFKRNEQTFVCFTSSNVLMEQLEEYDEHIPFETQIKKIKRYYTFS